MQTGNSPRALVPVFNRVILELAPTFTAQASAPSTFGELQRCGSLIVWDGASDATIYGDAKVNHAFRAWHDSAHLRGSHDFTLQGETQAAELQCLDVLRAYPSAPRLWLELIRAEVTGQAAHLAAYGSFPTDQFAFVSNYLHIIGG